VHCAKCHGADGHGDAESMSKLRPPPRDFAERPWRFEVTAASIRRVIADGISGTAMAAQKSALSNAEIDQLADFVWELVGKLPVIERTLTDGERQLAASGFEIDRQLIAAPSLTLVDSKGTSLKLSDLQGKWVLLEFWGTTCTSCRKALPALHRFANANHGVPVELLAVCADADDAPIAQALLTQFSPGQTTYVDPTGLGVARFGVQALPMTWIIDPRGRVRASSVGALDWNGVELRRTLAAFFAE